MENTKLPPLLEYFRNIEDPKRETKNKKYPLIEVIVIAFLAVMSGADGWVVESTRETGEEEAKTERRYFVSSLGADEKLFAHAVRAHCGYRESIAL